MMDEFEEWLGNWIKKTEIQIERNLNKIPPYEVKNSSQQDRIILLRVMNKYKDLQNKEGKK